MTLTITSGDDFDAFSNRWGVVMETGAAAGDHDVTQLSVATIEGEWHDAGALMQGEGFSYGTFEFDAVTRSNIVGPYALLWPQDDVWPGNEVDVLELHQDGSGAYSANHWDADPAHERYEDDRANWRDIPVDDTTRLHTYSVEWTPQHLAYAVDGDVYAVETDHVPLDADDGGVNMLPGIGIHLWPEALAVQDGTNAMTMTEFRYTEWNP